MTPWPLMVALVGFNYSNHLRGKPTLCGGVRAHLTPAQTCAAWALFSAYMVPHLLRRPTQSVNPGK